MTRVKGPARVRMERDFDRLVEAMDVEMRRVALRAAKSLGATETVTAADQNLSAVTVADLNPIRDWWSAVVDGRLLEMLTEMLFSSSDAQVRNVNRALGRQVVEPMGEQLVTELFMKNARNRLVAVGDDLWTEARDGLTEGLQAGESIPKLAKRVRASVNRTLPQARTVARTEVTAAYNEGAIETMRASELITTKQWLATPGPRTRLTHRVASGQTRPLDEPFQIGGANLDHPGDPSGPAAEVINCLTGDALVAWTGQDVLASTRRSYTGSFIKLRTVRGHILTVTPNHPILTLVGYRPARLIAPGDQVIATPEPNRAEPEVADSPPSVQKFHRSLRQSGVESRVAGGRMDFHGDGTDEEIHVVRPDRYLLAKGNLPIDEQFGEQPFVGLSDFETGLPNSGGGDRDSADRSGLNGPSATGHRLPSGGSVSLALLEGERSHSDSEGLAAGSDREVQLDQSPNDQGAAYAEFVRHLQNALALGMTPCEVVEVEVFSGSQDVYNLSTTDEWYTANGIMCHNCRCTTLFDVEVPADFEEPDDDVDTDEFDAEIDEFHDDHPQGSRFDRNSANAKRGEEAVRAMTVSGDDDMLAITRDADGEPRVVNGVDGEAIEEAVRAYQGTQFQSINGSLRESGGNLDAISQESDVSSIQGLDALMDASTFDDDVLIYRGIRNMQDTFNLTWRDDPDQDFTGFTWEDHGFSSSTFSESTVKNFGNRADGAILNMLVPKGSKAFGIGGFLSENEILLNRGAKFKIVRDRGKEGNARVFDVEVSYG